MIDIIKLLSMSFLIQCIKYIFENFVDYDKKETKYVVSKSTKTNLLENELKEGVDWWMSFNKQYYTREKTSSFVFQLEPCYDAYPISCSRIFTRKNQLQIKIEIVLFKGNHANLSLPFNLFCIIGDVPIWISILGT